jgi:hypothetical protein
MRRKAPEDRPLRLAPARARHEIRVWLGRDLYDRVLREAAARGTTTSHCVRECLDEYFVLKQQAAVALGIASDGGHAPQAAGQRLSHALLDALEQRVVSEIRSTEVHLDGVAEKIRLLACMIDQAYQGLVGRLPEVPPGLREARIAAADEATSRWRRAVGSLFREGGPESGEIPDAERSLAPTSRAATTPVRAQRRRTPEATGTD